MGVTPTDSAVAISQSIHAASQIPRFIVFLTSPIPPILNGGARISLLEKCHWLESIVSLGTQRFAGGSFI